MTKKMVWLQMPKKGKMSKKDRIYYTRRGREDGYNFKPLNKDILLDVEKSEPYKEGYREGCLDSMSENRDKPCKN